MANYKRQSTGQLSSITTILIVLGCYARIFTSIQETGDFLLVLVFVVAGVMNTIVLLQIFYYGNAEERKAHQAAAKKIN